MQREWLVMDWLCGVTILEDFVKTVGGEMTTVPMHNFNGNVVATMSAVRITTSLENIYELWKGKKFMVDPSETPPVIWITSKGFRQYG